MDSLPGRYTGRLQIGCTGCPPRSAQKRKGLKPTMEHPVETCILPLLRFISVPIDDATKERTKGRDRARRKVRMERENGCCSHNTVSGGNGQRARGFQSIFYTLPSELGVYINLGKVNKKVDRPSTGWVCMGGRADRALMSCNGDMKHISICMGDKRLLRGREKCPQVGFSCCVRITFKYTVTVCSFVVVVCQFECIQRLKLSARHERG